MAVSSDKRIDEIKERILRRDKKDVINELREGPKEIKDIFRQNRERNNRRRLRIVLEKQTIPNPTNKRDGIYLLDKMLFRSRKTDVINELREGSKEIKDIFRQNRERNKGRRLKILLEKQTIPDSTN